MSSPNRPLRRDFTLASANGAIWAVGNGLVSTTLVIYLALELGAPGAAIGLILAAPRFAGVLRLASPVLLARLRRRKPLCLMFLVASTLVLIAMPLLAAPGVWQVDSRSASAAGIGVLVACWCLYHALEYCGVVLLWAWLGDTMPPRVRGRLIGRRESWLTIGRVAGIGVSVALVQLWKWLNPAAARWEPLAWSATVGAIMLLVSLLPLVAMSSREARTSTPLATPWRAMAAALGSRRYRRLLTFSVGFAIANGLTAVAQNLYPQRVLGVGYEAMIGLRSVMFGGQAALAPVAGRWLDRHGPGRMLVVCQLIVATGPLFFFFATADAWWWLIGAFIAWIAYAAMNVGLDHLKLSLAPTVDAAPALAVYYVVSDLTNGLVAVAGGLLFDRLSAGGAKALWLYGVLFLAGWLARTAMASLAARIPDPRVPAPAPTTAPIETFSSATSDPGAQRPPRPSGYMQRLA